MSNMWKTSVTELVAIFRGALISIIPWLERAKIKWREGEAYDDWDNIADSLYKNIVCSTLEGEVSVDCSVAKYDFHYQDYSSINFLGVRSKEASKKAFAFVAFQSDSSPLDSVKVAELDGGKKVVRYSNLKLDGLEFFFIKNMGGEEKVITEVNVVL